MKYRYLIITLCLVLFYSAPVSAQTTPPQNSGTGGQQTNLRNDIAKLVTVLQTEANYTESKKAFLPVSEHQTIISQIQLHIEKLNSLHSQIGTQTLLTLRTELNQLQINTHFLRTIRLRRTAAILLSYQQSLQAYTAQFDQWLPLLLNSPLHTKTTKLTNCSISSQQQIKKADQFIIGIFSQIGLVLSLDAPQAAQLDKTLRTQMNEGKKTLDQARTQIRTCLDELKP